MAMAKRETRQYGVCDDALKRFEWYVGRMKRCYGKVVRIGRVRMGMGDRRLGVRMDLPPSHLRARGRDGGRGASGRGSARPPRGYVLGHGAR